MKLSELEEKVKEAKDMFGDMEVFVETVNGEQSADYCSLRGITPNDKFIIGA